MSEWKGPAEVFHPGEYLRDELKERGLTVDEFAKSTTQPPARWQELIDEKRPLNMRDAADLGNALEVSPETWNNLQRSYDLWKPGAGTRYEVVNIPVDSFALHREGDNFNLVTDHNRQDLEYLAARLNAAERMRNFLQGERRDHDAITKEFAGESCNCNRCLAIDNILGNAATPATDAHKQDTKRIRELLEAAGAMLAANGYTKFAERIDAALGA